MLSPVQNASSVRFVGTYEVSTVYNFRNGVIPSPSFPFAPTHAYALHQYLSILQSS